MTVEEAIDKLQSFKDKKKDIYCWNPYTDSYNHIKDICLDMDADIVITLE